MKIKTVIMLASNKKEAISRAIQQYGEGIKYVKPYKYASKGNNFYEFKI